MTLSNLATLPHRPPCTGPVPTPVTIDTPQAHLVGTVHHFFQYMKQVGIVHIGKDATPVTTKGNSNHAVLTFELKGNVYRCIVLRWMLRHSVHLLVFFEKRFSLVATDFLDVTDVGLPLHMEHVRFTPMTKLRYSNDAHRC